MASQVACTDFQNAAAVRSACASAEDAARPIAATKAQTAARMVPPVAGGGMSIAPRAGAGPLVGQGGFQSFYRSNLFTIEAQ